MPVPPKTPTQKPLFWKKQIDYWKRSGLSQKQFCQEKDLKFCTFKYWRQKLSRKDEGISFVPIRLIEKDTPVLLKNELSGLTIRCSDHFFVDLSVGFDVDSLKRLVKVFEQI